MLYSSKNCQEMYKKVICLLNLLVFGGCLHEKTHTCARVSYRDDLLISYRVYMMGHFISRLFEGKLHVDKIHVPFKIANVMHALPKTGGRFVFTWYRCRFPFGVKFSLRCNNRGELTPGWVVLGWHFVLVSCLNKCRAIRGSRSELAPVPLGRWILKSPLREVENEIN